MAYAIGLRLLAACCFLTVIGAPLGLWFLKKAKEKEKRSWLKRLRRKQSGTAR